MFITRVIGESYQELVTFARDWRLSSRKELLSVQALSRPHKMGAEPAILRSSLNSEQQNC